MNEDDEVIQINLPKTNIECTLHYDYIDYEMLKELLLSTLATPRKPILDFTSVPHYICPTCHKLVKLFNDPSVKSHCQFCNQKLDWRNYE